MTKNQTKNMVGTYVHRSHLMLLEQQFLIASLAARCSEPSAVLKYVF